MLLLLPPPPPPPRDCRDDPVALARPPLPARVMIARQKFIRINTALRPIDHETSAAASAATNCAVCVNYRQSHREPRIHARALMRLSWASFPLDCVDFCSSLRCSYYVSLYDIRLIISYNLVYVDITVHYSLFSLKTNSVHERRLRCCPRDELHWLPARPTHRLQTLPAIVHMSTSASPAYLSSLCTTFSCRNRSSPAASNSKRRHGFLANRNCHKRLTSMSTFPDPHLATHYRHL